MGYASDESPFSDDVFSIPCFGASVKALRGKGGILQKNPAARGCGRDEGGSVTTPDCFNMGNRGPVGDVGIHEIKECQIGQLSKRRYVGNAVIIENEH